MTNRIYERIDGPGVWKAEEIDGKAGLTHQLDEKELGVLDDFLRLTRDKPIEELNSTSFDSAALREMMANVQDCLQRGRGAQILSGFNLGSHSIEDFERIYRYLGTHLGRLVVQSAKGDLLGHVRHVTDSKARGYLSDMELGPHTDYHEILSLASVRMASRGGESGLTSALAVYNEILDTRPDLLDILHEGFYNGLPVRYGVMDDVHSDRRVPVFSSVDGQVSVFTLSFMGDAAAARGEELPPKLLEALRYMHGIAARETFQAHFMLQPGEMMFWNNRTVFHSRTRFENENGNERLLLRLWIEAEHGRPVHPEVAASAEMVERFHERGLDQREFVPA